MPKQAPVPLQPSHRKKKKKRLPKAIRILLVMLPYVTGNSALAVLEVLL